VPVDGEPLAAVSAYGNDRVFVRIALAGSAGPDPSIGSNVDARLAELSAAGHPVLRVAVDSKIDIGAEFVRWEVATALCGVVLGSTRSISPTSRRRRRIPAPSSLPSRAAAPRPVEKRREWLTRPPSRPR